MSKLITGLMGWAVITLMILAWPFFPLFGYCLGNCGKDPVGWAFVTYLYFIFEFPLVAVLFMIVACFMGVVLKPWRSKEHGIFIVKRWLVSIVGAALMLLVVALVLRKFGVGASCSFGW
jgi:hypothetical protein